MIPRISFHPAPLLQQPKFSILIPSWNNLAYLQTCVNSIRKNSAYYHEIIVHVNEGKDGTLDWVRSQGIAHTHSAGNTGVCYGFNGPAALAQTQHLILSDDDYYYTPGWDKPFVEELGKLDHIYYCLTGTIIEHSPSQYDSILANHNYGKTVADFDEERFLREYMSIPFHDWTGGNWYPLLLHRNIWSLIGGLSIEFTPGMASDPDMMMKLWHCGVRYYKGFNDSRIYHFGSRTTSRVKKNNGNKQFLLKWGLAKSTFFKHYLHLGEKFTGDTPEPDPTTFRTKLMRDRVKGFFSRS